MKKLIIIFVVAMIGFAFTSNAQTTVPFAYSGTIEFAKIDKASKDAMLKWAKQGAFQSAADISADTILQITLVKGIPISRGGGKNIDQAWIQSNNNGKLSNTLWDLDKLPKICKETCSTGKLKISGFRGSSNAITGPVFARNPW